MPDSTAEERNEATARRYFDVVWNERRPDRIGEFAHPDGVAYQACGVLVGRDTVREVVVDRLLAAFPDMHIAVEAVVARGDEAVVRWLATGTHRGDGLGMRPTGARMSVPGITWLRLRDGKISEGWDAWDHGGMLERLWRAAAANGDGRDPVPREGPGERRDD